MVTWEGTVFRYMDEVVIEATNLQTGCVRYFKAPKKDCNGKRLRCKDRCDIVGTKIYKREPIKYTKKQWKELCDSIQEKLKDI